MQICLLAQTEALYAKVHHLGFFFNYSLSLAMQCTLKTSSGCFFLKCTLEEGEEGEWQWVAGYTAGEIGYFCQRYISELRNAFDLRNRIFFTYKLTRSYLHHKTIVINIIRI